MEHISREEIIHSTNRKLSEAELLEFERKVSQVPWLIEPRAPFSYDNTKNLSSCPALVQVQKSSIQQGYFVNVIHYLGMCQYCFDEPTEDMPLKKCSKCRIVAYCSRDCQTRDWISHKEFCKSFPLRVGKDEMNYNTPRCPYKVTSESHNELVEELKKRSHRLVLMKIGHTTIGVNKVIRMCNLPGCHITSISKLYCCKCLEKCYCCQIHQEKDIEHQEVCNKIYIKINTYTRNNSKFSIPYRKAYPDSTEYRPLRGGKAAIHQNIIDNIKEEVVTEDIANDKWTQTQVEILADRLTMPFTILYCLQKLGVGQHCSPLVDVKTLNIHVLTAMPMFDPQMWECLLHCLPNLRELNITFVGWAGLNWHPNNVLNTMINFERCADCEKDDRVVSFKVLLSHYHMYFSSEDYVEPDVVAIFGWNKKLLDAQGVDRDDFHEVTSLRNMTYNKDTLVIVTDHEKSWLENAFSDIRNARPINILMPVTLNPLKAEGHIDNMRYHGRRFNILKYLTCVQRK